MKIYAIFPIRYSEIYIYKNPEFLCVLLKKNQNYLTNYVRLWINLFFTFTGRFVAYSVFKILAQYV